MKRFHFVMKKFNAARRLFLPIGLLLIFFSSIIINIASPSTNFNLIPVIKKTGLKSDSAFLSSLPIIQEYDKVTVYGEAVIRMKKNSLINFIAPKTELFTDNLYALAGISTCLIFCINFWHYNKSKIFTKKLLNTILWIQIVLTLTWILNIIRYSTMRSYFQQITNNEYSFDNFPFSKPEFWLLLLFVAFAKIVKHGIQIQQEQDLTV